MSGSPTHTPQKRKKEGETWMEEIKYKEIEKESVDDLVFLCINISTIAEADHIEHVFMRLDFVTFISVRYYENGQVMAATWSNEENPYAFLFRNDFGQLQSGAIMKKKVDI